MPPRFRASRPAHLPAFALKWVPSLVILLNGPQGLPAQVPNPVGKTQAIQAAALPTHAYIIQGKPSEVAQNPEALLALAQQLDLDLRHDLKTCDIQNRGWLQGIHTNLYMIAVLKQDPGEALKQRERVQALTEDPTSRAMVGLVADPWVAAKANPGGDFRATYRARLSQRLAKLPFHEFQFVLTSSAASIKTLTKAALVGRLESGLDPQVKDGKLTQEMAETILNTAYRLNIHLAMREDIVACIEALVEAHKHDAPVKFDPVIGTPKTPIKGAWFGQAMPGEKPMRFAGEILEAINPWAGGIAFSPDGKECFLAVGTATYSGSRLYQSHCVSGRWTPLVTPPFLAEFEFAGEPSYSPDGKTLFLTGKMAGKSGDLYTLHRTDTGWSAPVPMAAPINSEDNEYRGSKTADGTFYFGRNKAGKMEIHKAARDASGTVVVEKLGPPVNGQTVDGDPCIAPDGRWLVFYSGRPGGQGSADLWVSFSDGKGNWGNPINLGPEFNGPYDEFGANLSPDGKILFYNRHTPKGDETYWLAASAIDRFKP